MISVTGVGIDKALPDLVSITVVMVLSEGGGGAFVSPRSTCASWTISFLISEVTTKTSVATSRVDFTMGALTVETWVKCSPVVALIVNSSA